MEYREALNPRAPKDKALPLAIVTVPMQEWRDLYVADVGFERGTIFEQLDLPFIGEEAVKHG